MDGHDESDAETSIKKKSVFLFKSPKESELDKFTEVLEHAGVSCSTIPVLSFRFVNQSALKTHLGALHLFSAIIFTSVRAVEAVARLVKELNEVHNISQIQSFVVGHTTADAARKYGFSPKGENSGSALTLAEFILQEVGSDNCKPMLYPCSNIHRDTLKEILTSHGVQLTEVIAYETCPNERLKGTTEEAIQSQGLPDYSVFFSPSGFQYTLAAVDKELFPLDKIRIIALGPATQKCICDHGYTPFGTAEKPDPKSLLELLL